MGKHIPQKYVSKLIWLWTSILPQLIILIFFKYYNFFVPSGSDSLRLLMPLGISYYTFKIISYLADLYLNKCLSQNSFVDYALYVSFFPQIICGPIMRASDLMDQIKQNFFFHKQKIYEGLLLIISGLFKKIVIADRLNTYVTAVFNSPAAYPALALWMAAFFFSIQIYCDFAGYSEIAIGIGNLFGIECKPNFNLPYLSYNIKDFWKRWHISLSSWLRDYIYIPLGGSRKGAIRQNMNIIITFLVSGLWHGNTLNFVFWGLWHGLLNLIPSKKSSKKFIQIFQTLLTFFCVMFGWILFKSESLKYAGLFIHNMFSDFTLTIQTIIASVMPFTGDYSCLAHLMVACLLIFILLIFEWKEFRQPAHKYSSKYIVFFTCIILFGIVGENSFLYANF